MKIPQTDKFLADPSEDEHGNILNIQQGGSQHFITFNFNHWPPRGTADTEIDWLNQETRISRNSIKDSMTGKVIWNANDQCQIDKLVKCISALYFKFYVGLNDQINSIKKLHGIYCINYLHPLTDKEEN